MTSTLVAAACPPEPTAREAAALQAPAIQQSLGQLLELARQHDAVGPSEATLALVAALSPAQLWQAHVLYRTFHRLAPPVEGLLGALVAPASTARGLAVASLHHAEKVAFHIADFQPQLAPTGQHQRSALWSHVTVQPSDPIAAGTWAHAALGIVQDGVANDPDLLPGDGIRRTDAKLRSYTLLHRLRLLRLAPRVSEVDPAPNLLNASATTLRTPSCRL